MATGKTNSVKIEKPLANFDSPRQVVADPSLSKEEKTEALETLEQDARLLSTASEEGMTGGEETNLHDVLNAQERLKGGIAVPRPGSEAEVAEEVEKEKLDP
jgi:hypothetical protein